jgi:hypothetical protein
VTGLLEIGGYVHINIIVMVTICRGAVGTKDTRYAVVIGIGNQSRTLASWADMRDRSKK